MMTQGIALPDLGILVPGWIFIDNGDGTFSPRKMTPRIMHPAAATPAELSDDQLRELTQACLAEMSRRKFAPKTDKAKARAARREARKQVRKK